MTLSNAFMDEIKQYNGGNGFSRQELVNRLLAAVNQASLAASQAEVTQFRTDLLRRAGELTNADMPETDLVKIAEREVVEKARLLRPWLVDNLLRLPLSLDVDDFIRAVTLLESREQIRDQIGVEK